MAAVLCATAVRGYTASEPKPLGNTPQLSVAWLTEQQATRGATITYIDPALTLPNSPLLTQLSQREATAPPEGRGKLVCEAANKVLSTDNWCEILCEKNVTGRFTTLEYRTSPVSLWQGGARAQGPKPGQCDPDYCECHDPSAPKDPFVKMTLQAEKDQPSGLPECLWMAGEGCNMENPYECLAGEKEGQCSDMNWFNRPDECAHSCIHTKVLYYSATAREWKKGPLAQTDEDEKVPHYKHDACMLTLEVPSSLRRTLRAVTIASSCTPLHQARGIDVGALHVLMTSACKKPMDQTPFVGITFFSPKYKSKAERLLRSCTRHGICCKATQAPDSFGPGEGQMARTPPI